MGSVAGSVVTSWKKGMVSYQGKERKEKERTKEEKKRKMKRMLSTQRN